MSRRMHPFRIACYELALDEYEAAEQLGISKSWLSKILNDTPEAAPSLELYENMVRVSKGNVTLRKLLAHRPLRRPVVARRRAAA